MTQGPSCLADRDLEEFLVGTLPRDEAEAVSRHLSGCRRCQEAMVRLNGAVALSRTPEEMATAAPASLRTEAPPNHSVAVDRKAPSSIDRLKIPGYEILGELGRGGMGVVYEAFDRARNSRVALKTIRNKDAAALYRFKQEFRALADLSHTNLISLHELSATGDEWFFTMPIVEGVDFLSYVRPDPGLRIIPDETPGQKTVGTEVPITTGQGDDTEAMTDAKARPASGPWDEATTASTVGKTEPGGPIRTTIDRGVGGTTIELPAADAVKSRQRAGSQDRWDRSGFPLDLERLRRALPQLARGVLALHGAGKLHRDIKPSNVLVRDDGTVLLLDFGLVAELEPVPGGASRPGTWENSEIDNMVVGTVGYMAPEQAAGEPLSRASDWYAVGVMLFEALTGRLPFRGGVRQILSAKQEKESLPPIERDPSVPPDLNQLCVDLLRRDPVERLSGLAMLARLGEEAPCEAMAEAETLAPSMLLVGRGQELASLDAWYAEVLAGKAATVEVHGRSGAGKSSLVQRFLDGLAADRHVVILAGRCFEQESIPYKAVDQLVDALTRYLCRLRHAEASTLMPRDIGALARIFPVLWQVEAVAEARSRTVISPDLQSLRNRAFGALRELLARIGASHPLVLCIDDIQWGDVDSAALLTELIRPPDPPRLMLLACYRSEYLETSACLRALRAARLEDGPTTLGRELRIAPLSPEAARELAHLLLRSHGPEAADRADQIASESGGNPYFVYELARHVIEGMDWSSHRDGINLDEVLWSRIRRMPEDSRQFLTTLAVAGKPVKVGLAYTASDLMAAKQQVVAALRAGHLVRGTGPSLDDDIETYHDRIREVIVDRLDREGLRHHHGRLAATLEADGAADPETLAVHFHGADRAAEAGRYYAEAADLAAQALAFDRAAKLYRQSIELQHLPGDEGRRLNVRMAESLANAGRCAEAAEEYLVAATTAGTAERIDLERRAAFQFCASGQMDAGRKVLRTVLRRVGMKLPDNKPRALVMLIYNRLRLGMRGLTFRERDAALVRAEELTRIDLSWSVGTGLASKNILVGPAFQSLNLLMSLRAGEPRRIARALCWEAAQLSIDGISALKRTDELLEAAEVLAGRLDEPYIDGMVALARGYRDFCLGRFRGGRLNLEHAEGIFRERCTGAAWELAQANTHGLWCISYEGDWPEVRRRSARLLEEAQKKGNLFMQVNLGTFMEPLSRLADDRPEEAARVIKESIERWSRQEFNIQNMTALMGSTYVDLYRGDPAVSHARHRRQWPALKGAFLLHSQICRLLVTELRARSALGVAASSRNPAPLLREVEKRATFIGRENMPYGDALAHLLLAGVAAIRRDSASAERLLIVAAQGFDSVPMHLFAAAARRRLGELRGGSEGRALVESSDQWMFENEIRNPERMTAAIAPWTPR